MIENTVDFIAGYVFGLIVALLLNKYVIVKKKGLDWATILKNHFKNNNMMTSESYENYKKHVKGE